MNIPKQIRAGDKTTWIESLYDYPATLYKLYFKLSGSAQIPITASASGSDHIVTITKTISQNWAKGFYSYVGYVEEIANTDNRTTLESGTIEILQNIVALTGTQEGRSFVRRMLEAIEATLENRATKEQKSLTAPGTAQPSLELLSHDELIRAYYKWKRAVADEERAEKIARGQDGGGKYLFRFTNP